MKFSLIFNLDNDAFVENRNQEIARILLNIANTVASDQYTAGFVRDINGNRVGEWAISGEQE